MKKLSLIVFLLLSPAVNAAVSGYPLDRVKIDLGDKPSLQRGAKYVVNYCMGCHSLQYLRYNRLAHDLDLPDKLVEENLIFTHNEEGAPTKIGELMTIPMDKLYADKAFGVVPPDLTLVTRVRSPQWVYTYMRTFYLDADKQWGVNNAVFPNVGMPHVLWDLQGWQKPIYREHSDEQGRIYQQIVGFDLVEPGSMTPEEYDRVVSDITNFLVYAAEPARLSRYTVGAWVIFFLLILVSITYFLKKEYWRDVK